MDAPVRVLPIDERLAYRGPLGTQGRNERLGYDALERLGLIAPAHDPDRYFSQEERMITAWLRERSGIAVRSVADANHLGKTPDAVIDVERLTVEFKTLTMPTTIAARNAITSARSQSDRIIVNGESIGLPAGIAAEALARALGLIGAVAEAGGERVARLGHFSTP